MPNCNEGITGGGRAGGVGLINSFLLLPGCASASTSLWSDITKSLKNLPNPCLSRGTWRSALGSRACCSCAPPRGHFGYCTTKPAETARRKVNQFPQRVLRATGKVKCNLLPVPLWTVLWCSSYSPPSTMRTHTANLFTCHSLCLGYPQLACLPGKLLFIFQFSAQIFSSLKSPLTSQVLLRHSSCVPSMHFIFEKQAFWCLPLH